jgi:hypothetical protein
MIYTNPRLTWGYFYYLTAGKSGLKSYGIITI